jgi:hypothetical protein
MLSGDLKMRVEDQGPKELMQEVARLRLPETTDRRMQLLMDRNNDGLLTACEHDELESLVAVSETVSLLRAKALRILGWTP